MLSLIAARGCRAVRLLQSAPAAPKPHAHCLSAAVAATRRSPIHFSSSSQSSDEGADAGVGASSAGESNAAAATRRARAPKRSFASNLQPLPFGSGSGSGGGGGGTFVSAHFEVPNFDIITYLKRRHLSYTENEAHFIVRLCPFCHPQRDSTDHFKLYILKSRGVFHCHRCQAQGTVCFLSDESPCTSIARAHFSFASTDSLHLPPRQAPGLTSKSVSETSKKAPRAASTLHPANRPLLASLILPPRLPCNLHRRLPRPSLLFSRFMRYARRFPPRCPHFQATETTQTRPLPSPLPPPRLP